ncbi:MAG: hypothetical protein SOI28_04165 [Rahnella inusitata]|jgi:hypothetical protein|uniref:T6SS immunity protein Tli3 family protein n=1 Tax=Rahnella inusitata TaxID=58169 RepID=UPI001BC82FAA|nr:hypothetical protein [Rahnella inusitata]QUT14530.1 hypothetical protein I2123_17945 [Rahnella inusitata]
MKTLNKLACASATIFSCLLITACHIPTAADGFAMTTGGAGLTEQSGVVEYMIYNVPPQVVYRIDNHRFFTLENYKDCDHGGIVYYNDTKLRKKIYISGGSSSNDILTKNPTIAWQGKFIYAAGEKTITAPILMMFCPSERMDCTAKLKYWSDDKKEIPLPVSFGFSGDNIDVAIFNDGYYIINKAVFSYKYKLYPTPSDEDGIRVDKLPEEIQTPSGTSRFSCNSSISSDDFSKTRKQTFDPNATEAPQNGQ